MVAALDRHASEGQLGRCSSGIPDARVFQRCRQLTIRMRDLWT
jgi:hypothetical protein